MEAIVSGVTSVAIVSYLAGLNGGYATQRQISEALGINQSTVSKVVKATPGIIANDKARPAIYSFDATGIVDPVNKTNDIGVIRPDGRILIGDALFTPVSDTLAELSTEELKARVVKFSEIILSQKDKPFTKETWEQAQKQFDSLAITIRSRINKGDFDGTNH